MTKPKQTIEPNKILLEQQVFTGLLPPPDMLKNYDKIYQGMAHEIVELAQEAQKHYIFMERQEARRNFLSLIFSFILGIVGQIGSILITLAGFYMAYFYINAGEPTLGYWTAGSSAVICGYLIWWKVKTIDKDKTLKNKDN